MIALILFAAGTLASPAQASGKPEVVLKATDEKEGREYGYRRPWK